MVRVADGCEPSEVVELVIRLMADFPPGEVLELDVMSVSNHLAVPVGVVPLEVACVSEQLAD